MKTTKTLPIEIIAMILEHLSNDQHTLTRCCLISWTLHSVAAPILYRKIVISPIGRSSTTHLFGDHLEPTTRFNLLQHARSLKLDSHNYQWCSSLPFNFCDISILTINHINCMICGQNGTSNITCNILNTLRPKCLIIRNADLKSIRVPTGTPPTVFDDVEEIIFISPTSTSYISNSGRALPNMDKLKKFTWIFWTKNEFYEKWKLTPEDDRCKRRNSILYRSMFHLASVLFGLKDTVDITIVNSGCLQELEWRILSPMELQIQTKIGIGRGLGFAARRQYIAQRLPDVPRSEAEKRDQVRAKSRSEDIQCRTMIEYLNSIHWQDVFEKDEVKHWIKV